VFRVQVPYEGCSILSASVVGDVRMVAPQIECTCHVSAGVSRASLIAETWCLKEVVFSAQVS